MTEQTVLEKSSPITQSEQIELEKNEIATFRERPYGLVTKGYLHIKTKAADLIPLNLNDTQKSIMKIILDLKAKNKPIRLWILKARQEGVSTLIESINFSYTSQQENINCLIMADEKEHANNLFDMSKLYHEMLDKKYSHLAPRLKKSNEKKLEFDGIHSQMIIATAENLEAAKSHTYQMVHLSECAYFRDLKAVMSDLNQTVPDLPGTMIIGETTANGMEAFYDGWIRAVQGKTDWLPVFIPWFAMKEYSMPLEGDKLYPLEGILFDADNSQQGFLREEERLVKEYELTQEQLNWRRYAITNKCEGEITIFNREYPSSWEVAFQTSGKTFFNQPSLQRQMKRTPKRVGDIFKEENKYVFRDLPNGRIKLYENPQPNEQYIVPLDASEAIGEDEASGLVLNNRLNRVVAVVNGQYEPELLADIGAKLGYFYNEAIVAPENKGYGYSLCQSLNQIYGNIYRRKITKNGKTERTDELGFNTNLNTRPEMLARAAEVILYNSCELVDAALINQCQTFIINPKTKKAEAALNKEDGLVICFAIAQQVRHEHPYSPPRNQTMQEIAAKRRIEGEVAVGTKF